MPNVIYSMLVSLDGFIEGPNRELDWHVIDEEFHTFANDHLRTAGAFLYGRRMYENMAAFWPTGDEDPALPEYVAEFARIWRPMPKVVFSRTLQHADWNARIVRDDLPGAIAELKAQAGGDLWLGGPTIAAAFDKLGLIDEVELIVQPVILGRGTPMFGGFEHRTWASLVESRTLGSGVVILRYRRGGPSDALPETAGPG